MATCTEISAVNLLLCTQVGNEPRLQMVGQAETEFGRLAGERIEMWQGSLHIGIAVIGTMLVDDISHHAVCPGRLDAKTPAAVYAAEPNDATEYLLFTAVGNIVYHHTWFNGFFVVAAFAGGLTCLVGGSVYAFLAIIVCKYTNIL